jgi:hypothetical protein
MAFQNNILGQSNISTHHTKWPDLAARRNYGAVFNDSA